MSMIAFVFAVTIFYYLYTSYFANKDEENERSRREEEIEYHHTKFQTSVFKNFLKTISDRANNNIHTLVEERPDPFVFRAFEDRFRTLSDVTSAIREAGLVDCRVVLGVDFTASNEWQGRKTHSGRSLHHVNSKSSLQNPYHHVMSVLHKTLGEHMQNPDAIPRSNSRKSLRTSIKLRKPKQQHIYPYGFGDSVTKDKTVFPLTDELPCSSFDEVIELYKAIAPSIILGGPTSYAPIIRKAIELVRESDNQYHILIIIADGQFTDPEPSAKAIVDASNCPLSIIVIGVGDGPWNTLRKFDDWLPQRKFDNFQFVEYYKILKANSLKSNPEATFALHMLMEIPDQFKTVRELGLLERRPEDKNTNE